VRGQVIGPAWLPQGAIIHLGTRYLKAEFRDRRGEFQTDAGIGFGFPWLMEQVQLTSDLNLMLPGLIGPWQRGVAMVSCMGSIRWWGGVGIALVVAIFGLWAVCNDHPEPGPAPTGSVATVAGTPAMERFAKAADQAPADSNDKPGSRSNHRHHAFGERTKERRQMVVRQIQARDIQDPCVLEAMRTVPRHAFVPGPYRDRAYGDCPLPIGHGQTISQPYIVAFMTEALHLDPNSRVLEIGTGSGYQAAVCAQIAREVFTIEIVPELAKSAAHIIKELGYTNVHVRAGDGFFGWRDKAPFDAIIGTAAAEQIPEPLVEQLKPKGRMILPCEDADGLQYLVLVTKDQGGELSQRRILPVRFVPMTGQAQEPQTQ
jgi:protein-L-isoaspartate(D-aspartate) O-methyltransferase